MNDPSTSHSGSYLAPRIEHARVADAMRHGVLSVASDSSLRQAARTMTLHHIHTVVLTDPHSGALAGVVHDRALAMALAGGQAAARLAELVDRDVLTLSASQPLAEALEQMRAHALDHAVVIDPQSGRPTGMLSTLDVLGVFAWGEV